MTEPTVTLTTLVSRVNGMNAAPSAPAEGRRAVNALLERILLDADEYRGFQYVFAGGEQVPTGQVVAGHYDPDRRRYYGPLRPDPDLDDRLRLTVKR